MAVSRRNLLAGGAIVAAAAIPVGTHIWWGSKDYGRADFDPDLPEAPAGEKAWQNWSGLQKATPRKIITPSNAEDVAALVKEATAPIRPVGSGHSFTPLVPSEGTIVDISALAGLVSYDAATQTASLGAGTRLQQAARVLDEQGLAFANLPDIDVQTLAGGFSTATHGTGRNLTAIHDYVQGFELVTPEGDIKQVTAASDPDLFGAGKVSLGALGVITRYELKLEKSFNLRRRAILMKTADVLNDFEALSKKHRNFETVLFPGTGHAAAFIHDIHEGPLKGRLPSEDEDFLAGLRELRDTFGWWPWLRKKAFAGAVEEGAVEDTTDAAWKLLSTSRPTKFNEMEYHMPLDGGLAVLRQVVAKMDTFGGVYFPIEARVTAPDDAWLSPFNDGHRLSIAIHMPANESFDFFFQEFEPLFRKNGGRPHWGKLHSLTGAELTALYPRFADFNALRKELDPQGKFISPYMAKLWGTA